MATLIFARHDVLAVGAAAKGRRMAAEPKEAGRKPVAVSVKAEPERKRAILG